MATATISFSDGDLNGTAKEAALLARAMIANTLPSVGVQIHGDGSIIVSHENDMMIGLVLAWIKNA